ncbi:hypothetical protein KMZ93_07250 [Bradyrhizobium sediminis]|uniref:Uncharacterized protein n=1 Tax=Bradyrhizobium sediminis TaxID=2840469 RepID=A0A975P0H8_9BRAD|nr:hypothetical protein [Bradyrhizobium sediminis]QWG24682.1 hypothetical protein KMZ93_07250 [Bradyrhizobium sediminis]
MSLWLRWCLRCGLSFRSSQLFPHDETEVPTEAALLRRFRRHFPCFFLGQQFQEHLPTGIVFGSSKLPFEDDQVLAVYEFFHNVLLWVVRSGW